MARLYMEGATSPALAANGNRNSARVILSVTDSNGNGVTGLAVSDFIIGNPVVGAGGASVVIDFINPSGPGGAYVMGLLPNGVNNWADGRYLISLDVASGTDDGQTVFSLDIP